MNNRSKMEVAPVAEVRPHVIDGIEEYDNPLPRWWLGLFYFTIAFAVVYSVMYPSFWFWPGTTRWTEAKQWEEAIANAPTPVSTPPPVVDLAKMAADPSIVATGQQMFKTYCVVCHGENAEGKVGPPLVPHHWRYGGDSESILTTIRGGRPGGMPVWSKALSEDKIEIVAAYVFSLQNRPFVEDSGAPKTAPGAAPSTAPVGAAPSAAPAAAPSAAPVTASSAAPMGAASP